MSTGNKKLGKGTDAKQRFEKLFEFGKGQLKIPFKMDYFAVSLPDLLIFEDDLQLRHEQYCHYLIGLGNLGLGNKALATDEFNRILSQNKYHIGAKTHLEFCNLYYNQI